MLPRSKFFLLKGIQWRRWAIKYGITPFAMECHSCGARRETTIPFVLKNIHGLIAPDCECGAKDNPYCCLIEDLSEFKP